MYDQNSHCTAAATSGGSRARVWRSKPDACGAIMKIPASPDIGICRGLAVHCYKIRQECRGTDDQCQRTLLPARSASGACRTLPRTTDCHELLRKIRASSPDRSGHAQQGGDAPAPADRSPGCGEGAGNRHRLGTQSAFLRATGEASVRPRTVARIDRPGRTQDRRRAVPGGLSRSRRRAHSAGRWQRGYRAHHVDAMFDTGCAPGAVRSAPCAQTRRPAAVSGAWAGAGGRRATLAAATDSAVAARHRRVPPGSQHRRTRRRRRLPYRSARYRLRARPAGHGVHLPWQRRAALTDWPPRRGTQRRRADPAAARSGLELADNVGDKTMSGSNNAATVALEEGDARHIALECGERSVTYGQLRSSVARAAGAWRALGLQADERVIVLAPDGIEWVEAYLGAMWAGGVPVGVNPRLSMTDLAPIVAESGARNIWAGAELASAVAQMAHGLPSSPRVVAPCDEGGGVGDWRAYMARADECAPAPRAPGDMALWIGTSGTTGTPKAVIHTHGVTAPCAAFARQVLGAGPGDRLYATSKLFFAYALANSLFAGLRLGATVILDGEWPTPERVAEVVERHRPTILFSVPTLYHKMLQAGVAQRLAASSVRRYVSAGEALPPAVRERWTKLTGVRPVSGYGTSETLCLMLYCDDGSGRLAPTPLTELRYNAVPADVPQRIWVRHPAVARGYWNRPEAQADG